MVDTDYLQYGVHYGYGDFLKALVDGELIDVGMDTVNLHVEAGQETVGVLLRSDDAV